jgi:hypothetical protein
MTKLLVALSAQTWGPTNSQHMDRWRRNEMAAALRLVAERIQNAGSSDGTMTRGELEVVFKLSHSATADTADEAA